MSTAPPVHRPLWPLLFIVLLALAVRLFYLGEIAASPLFEVPVVDAKTYVDDALYLSGTSWAGRAAPFWQPPLYPYTLALIFELGGRNYYLPRLFQALLGAAICAMVYLVGRPVFPLSVALAAGCGAALYGPLIYFGGELLPVTLAIFLFLLLLLLLPRRRWFGSGLLLGLGALAVANILLFLPFLLLWIWIAREAGGRPLRQSLLLLAGCALAIAPVSLRNYWIGGDRVLISHNAGVNFYLGNNPEYERTVAIRPGREWLRLVDRPAREAGIEVPSQKSRYFFAKSWAFISAHPLDYLALLARKLYLFWRGDERLRNLDPYYARRDSFLLGALLWKRGLAFPFGVVSPLALMGMAAFWRRPQRRSPRGQWLLLFVGAYMLSVVLFFVTSRYRLPAVPVLLLFAAFGARGLLRARAWKKALALPPLLLLLNWGVGPMDREGAAPEHFWRGYAYEQKNMPANAAREYRRALARRPDHEDALFGLAALHARRREYGEAIKTYRQYLHFYPQDAQVRFLLANTYLAAQRYDEAIAAYEELVPRRPQWAALFGRLGYACLMAGRPEQAATAYRRTLSLNPDSTLVRYQLARLYESTEQFERALDEYRTLLAREPENAEYHVLLGDMLLARDKSAATVHLEQTPRTREAERHFRRAIELRPNFVHPLWSLGMLLARQQRYSGAIEPFERILALAPGDYKAHLFLGHLYQRTGRAAQAQKHFELYTRGESAARLQQGAGREFEKQMKHLFGRKDQG